MNYVASSMTLRLASARHMSILPSLQVLKECAKSGSTGFAWPLMRTTSPYRTPDSRASFSASHFLPAKAKRIKTKPKKGVTTKTSTKIQAPAVAGEAESGPAPILSQPRGPKEETKTEPEVAEILTWRAYDPEGGMPLQGLELSSKEVVGIFGEGQDVELMQYVINVMNWRRQSGALIDYGTKMPPEMNVSEAQALKALEHIRQVEPDFDEEAAALVWVEEESQRLRADMEERSMSLGIYKRPSGEEAELEVGESLEEEESQKQGTPEGRKRSAESALLQERQRREAEFDRQQELKAQREEEAQFAALHSVRGPLELGGGVQPGYAIAKIKPKEVEATRRLEEARAWREEHARKSDPYDKYAQVPQMSLLARLGPSAVLVAATVAFAVWLADNYVAAPQSARMFPDIPARFVTIGSLTAILAGFFLLCRWPPFYATSLKYFAIWPPVPRAVSIIGAMFQHQGLRHFTANVVVLWGVGLTLHEDLGRGAFLAVLLGCGALGGFSSLTSEVLRKNWNFYTVGASSAILGMFATTCTIKPQRTLRILGHDVPIAVWILLVVSLTVDTIGLFTPYRRGIDFAGHLGGQVSGIAAGLYLRQRNAQNATSSDKKEP